MFCWHVKASSWDLYRVQLSNDISVDAVSMSFSIVVEHPLLSLQLDGLGVLLQAREVCFVPVRMISVTLSMEHAGENTYHLSLVVTPVCCTAFTRSYLIFSNARSASCAFALPANCRQTARHAPSSIA